MDNPTLQAKIGFKDPDFAALPKASQIHLYGEQDPDFAALPPASQWAVYDEISGQSANTPVQPEPKASWQNLGNAIGGGIGGAVKSLTDLNTYATVGSQIGQSFQTEAQNLNDPMGFLGALGQGAVKGVRDLGQGIVSLPSDIGNAAYGYNRYTPEYNIFGFKTNGLKNIPTAWSQNLQQHPVAGFVGEQLPYAIPVGRAFGAGKALEEANALSQLGRAAAEGAVIGGVIDPQGQGLQGRFQNATTAAAVTPAFYGAGKLVGKVAQRMPEPKAVEVKPQKIDRPIGLAGLSREPQLQVSARIAPEDGVQIINTQQRPQLAIPDNADLNMMPPVDERAALLAAQHEAQVPQGKAAQEADYKAKVSTIVDEYQQMHEIDQKEFRKEVLKGAAKKINIRNRKRDNPNFQINRDILKEIMDREKAQKQAENAAKDAQSQAELKAKLEAKAQAGNAKTAQELMGAIQSVVDEVTKKPESKVDELGRPADEYSRMAQEADTRLKAQKQAEKTKPNEQKAQTKQQERPEQPAPQNQPAGEQGQLTAKAEKTVKLTLAQERDAIAEALGNMTANNAVEPNAYDFFNQFGMKIRKINKAQGLAYQVTLPRYGTVTFTPKDTINSVIRQMRASRKSGQPDPLTSIAGVIRARGGLEAMRAELDALFSGQGDSYTNMESTSNLFDYAETKAANEVAGRYAEEDAHFTRIEDTYKAKIQNAKTFDDLDQIQQELEQIPEATYLADSLVDTYSAKIAELAKAGDNTNEAPIQEQTQPQRAKELPKNTGNDKASEGSPRQQEVIAKPFPKQAKPEPGEYVHPAGAQFIPEELTGRSYSKFEDLGNGKPAKNALAQLSPDQKKTLQTLVQAARQHKKVLARFYDVVDPTKRQKRAGYEDELSSILGFSVTKDENLLVHTYNELGQLSTRRMDQFSGDIEITKHGAYNGRHPSRYREPGKFNPVDALYERTMNPILKREALRQPIDPADYKLAAERFMDAYSEMPKKNQHIVAGQVAMKMPVKTRNEIMKHIDLKGGC